MKGNFTQCLLLLFLVFYSITFTAYSQEIDTISTYKYLYDTIAPTNDLLELPIHDLGGMRVTVASKKEEKISDAPSSITAYSAKEIENLGYYTLADLASITSGYNVTYQFGETGFVTRGQTAGGFNNNKHLLLIDGIPINFARSYKAQIQEDLPIYFAQRVEFLKGPASALYGVSAFYGVASLISKDPLTNGISAESKISAGNMNNNLRFMANVFQRNDNGSSILNVGYFQKNPSMDPVGNAYNPDQLYWDKNSSLFIKSSHRITSGIFNGASLGLIYLSRSGGLGESWNSYPSQINSINWKTLIPYIKYQKQVSRKISFNSYIKGNNSIEEATYMISKTSSSSIPKPLLSNYKSNVVNTEILGELKYDLNTRNSFIVGLNYDRRVEKGNPTSYSYFIFPPDSNYYKYSDTFAYDFKSRSFYFNTLSGYVQYQKLIPLLSGLTITGGLRYDKGIIGDFNYSQASPRIAIVQKITQKLNLKLMSGRALRAPSIKELDLTYQFLNEVNKIKPNSTKPPQIRAEVIQTYEAGINYTTKMFGVSATGFINKTTNEITSTTLYVQNGKDSLRGNWIINHSGKTISKGFEVDIYVLINNSLKIFSNYTYAIAKDSSNNYFAGIPPAQINGGIIYTNIGKYKWRSSLVVKHTNGYLIGGQTKDVSKGHTFIDYNAIIPITSTIHTELQIRNLLNEKVLFPTAGIPLPGRTFMATLGLSF